MHTRLFVNYIDVQGYAIEIHELKAMSPLTPFFRLV